MRRLSLIGAALAVVLVGLIGACVSDPVSRNPAAPSAPAFSSIQIIGPTSIAPGQSVQFVAEIRLSDGTVKSATNPVNNVRWRSSNTAVLQVTSSGLATAGQNGGEAVLTADVLPTGVIRSSREVLVLPDGTYRMVGFVNEAEAPTQPIIGARVEVAGTSRVATTGVNGSYRLYGVPPAAEIRLSANGYLPSAQNVELTAHATRNFQLALSGPRLSLNGRYTLAIDVVGACTGNPALPADLRNRRYDATVTTTGSLVDVLLTEPRFRLNSSNRGNRFTGRADALGVMFTLQQYYWYYYGYYGPTAYPNVAEQLENNTYLVIEGTAPTLGTNAGVSGTMSGGLFNFDSRFPTIASFLGSCSSSGLRLTLTPR